MEPWISVSEATALVKECIEEGLAPFWVEGEVSNFVAHTSGHFYFSLKDAHSQLRCVMFRGANRRLRFRPENGMACAAFGQVGVYAPSGQYQLIAVRMLPAGEGELQVAFEALKRRLEGEGLFAPERKRPLPAFPRVVGVVTSPTGAAIRDITRVLQRRWPPVSILLYPAKVQGEGAARQIAAGIAALEAHGEAELLIVGRGGGSLEDLWAFNEEMTARAIAEASVPVISAVGHETDVTIADFVADLRAPTPSAAAELAVRDYRETIAECQGLLQRSGRGLLRNLERMQLKLDALRRSRALQSPIDRLHQENQRADELFERSRRAVLGYLTQRTERLEGLGSRLEALNPETVLQRGYAVARDARGGVLRSASAVAVDDEIEVELGAGRLRCRVLDTRS